MRLLPPLAFAATILLLLPFAPVAQAQVLGEEHRTEEEIEHEFVQTRTCDPDGLIQSPCSFDQQPLPIQWNSNTVRYVINEMGSQQLHPDDDHLTDELKHSIIESFETWNEQECSAYEMVYDGTTTERFPGFDTDIDPEDNINLVVFRDDDWPHPHYHAVALTTVTFRPSNGEILSADIEINTAQFDFTDSDDDVVIDLRNTMTHEVGHFLGLDHSPNHTATMYFTAAEGETHKRELHDADIAGLCHIYPEGDEPNLPDGTNGAGTDGGNRDDNGRCSLSGQGPDQGLIMVILFTLAAICLRRRRGK